jgi:hypothetical protein
MRETIVSASLALRMRKNPTRSGERPKALYSSYGPAHTAALRDAMMRYYSVGLSIV